MDEGMSCTWSLTSRPHWKRDEWIKNDWVEARLESLWRAGCGRGMRDQMDVSLYTYSSSLEVLSRAEGKKRKETSIWVPLFLSSIFLIENAQPSWPVDNASSEVSFTSKIPWTLSVSFLYKKNLEEESESLPNGSSGQKETDWTHWKLFITCCPEGRIRIRKGPRLKDR